jgi:Family of unknown function (DUF5906)
MVHEGAKAARYVDWLIEDPEARKARAEHPWGAELAEYEHWGWIGGARNPHRPDWSELPNKMTVIACDHDQAGEDAVMKISATLQRSLMALRFGNAFPPKFDLADPFPKEMWKEKKGSLVYVGTRMADCLSPATWATRVIPSREKGGRPAFALRDEFVEEWLFSITPSVFIHVSKLNKRYIESEFNAETAPFSDADNVARLRRKKQWGKANTIVYEPGMRPGLIAVPDRGHVINCYQPSDIKPKKGNPFRFFRYLRHLIPDKRDREGLKRWIATLIARPDIHMVYGLLLISNMHGVGKTTLAEKILAPIIGWDNCSFPSAAEATEQSFTSWRAFKRLAVIGEIYDGQTSRAYNRLKDAGGSDIVRVDEKYEKPFDMRNFVHLFATSNSERALKIAGPDRRWFVPEVTEMKRSREYWAKFKEWLDEGGLSIIMWWAQEYVKDEANVVQAGEHAPDSAAKNKTIIASMSIGEKFVHDLGEELSELKEPCIIRFDQIRPWLANKKKEAELGRYDERFLETPETIARVLRMFDKLKFCGRKFKDRGQRFRVAANFEIDKDQGQLLVLG